MGVNAPIHFVSSYSRASVLDEYSISLPVSKEDVLPVYISDVSLSGELGGERLFFFFL